MSVVSQTAFAIWLKQHNPQVFKQLLSQARVHAIAKNGFNKNLGDFGDYASYITDGSVQAAGDMLPEIDVNSFYSGGESGGVFTAESGGLNTPVSAADISGVTASATDYGSLNTPVSAADIAGLTSSATTGMPTVSIPTAPVPSSVSPDAQTVGNYLNATQTALTIAKAAATVATGAAAVSAINAQAARAAAGQAPANITYGTTTDPNTGIVSLVPTLNGTVLNQSGLASLIPSTFLQSSGLWIMLGIGAVVLLAQD